MSGRYRTPRAGRSKYARASYARPSARRMVGASRAVSSRLRAARRPRIIRGSGAYSSSQGMPARSAQQVPYMHSKGNSFCIRHREYIGDIGGTVAFDVAKYRVNPQDPVSFPWLSQVAAAFEQYHFKGLAFEYVPTCGDALSSSNNALGTIIMAMNYNAADSLASSKPQLLEQMWAVSGKPSDHKLMFVECARPENPVSVLYTAADLPISYDPRLYDLGFLQVATQGMQIDGVGVGELWVTYDVELIKPQTTPETPNGCLHIGTNGIITGATDLQTLFSAANATAHTLVEPLDSVSILVNTITLPEGKFKVDILTGGAWNWTGAPALVFNTGATGINAIRNQTQPSDNVNYVSADGAITVFVSIAAGGGSLTLLPSSTGNAYADLYINELPSTFA